MNHSWWATITQSADSVLMKAHAVPLYLIWSKSVMSTNTQSHSLHSWYVNNVIKYHSTKERCILITVMHWLNNNTFWIIKYVNEIKFMLCIISCCHRDYKVFSSQGNIKPGMKGWYGMLITPCAYGPCPTPPCISIKSQCSLKLVIWHIYLAICAHWQWNK